MSSLKEEECVGKHFQLIKDKWNDVKCFDKTSDSVRYMLSVVGASMSEVPFMNKSQVQDMGKFFSEKLHSPKFNIYDGEEESYEYEDELWCKEVRKVFPEHMWSDCDESITSTEARSGLEFTIKDNNGNEVNIRGFWDECESPFVNDDSKKRTNKKARTEKEEEDSEEEDASEEENDDDDIGWREIVFMIVDDDE